ncbi:MAG: hypothetical protein QXK89_09375 [Candidatus Bathyarchaeia archaeon]
MEVLKLINERRDLKIAYLLTLSLILTFASISIENHVITPIKADAEKFTYYGVVPARLWRYNLTDEFDINSGWRLAYTPGTTWLLAMASWNEFTNIRVYNITYGELIAQATLGRMEKYYLLLRNGTAFKVESNNPICVQILNYGEIPFGNETSVPVPNTFYPATDGAYVGKEFIFLVSSDLQRRFTIFALEKSEVKITNETGAVINTLSLDPNSFQSIFLYPWRTYRVESTGYIMIQCGNPGSYWDYHYSFAIPSVQGGFVGTDFYTVANMGIDEVEDCGFRASAVEKADIKVYDLRTKEVLFEATVEAGSSTRFQVRSNAIKIESSAPISLSFVHDGYVRQSLGGGTYGSYGSGVLFIAVKANEPTPIYLPINSTCETYIFASEETYVEVDDYRVTVKPDKPLLITQPGVHKIRSDKNVVVQINHWPKIPEEQGIGGVPGTVIPCVETSHIRHNVNLTPLEEPFPIMLIVIAAAALISVALIAYYIVVRRKSRV